MHQILRDKAIFRTQCFINGQWCDADDKAFIEITNPANGKKLGHVPDCGTQETNRAIASASAAFPAWKRKTALERGTYLRAWEQAIRENLDDLAALLTLEEGKPLAEARAEILQGASYLSWFAEESRRVSGQLIPTFRHGVQAITRYTPLGVAAAITPWNFPMSMIPRKVAPALAAGCTVIVKPASATPYSALAMAELANRVGIPAGVFNVITGKAKDIGTAIANSPIVRKLSFTGSTEVGMRLAAMCAPTLKRLSLELGGNAPFIILDDADLDQAVQMAMTSKFRNAGQTCICANRFLVQRGVYTSFTEKLLKKIQALRIGDGFDSNTDMGPLINTKAVEHTAALVSDAIEKGAKLLCGGNPHGLGGNFYEPTLLIGLSSNMRIFQEEIFGPVAAVMPFETEEEAITLANDTLFGLASYVCTRDMGRMWRMFDALEYGMVGINDATLAAAEAPFGGVKFSGMGREGAKEGILEYMEVHYALLGGLNKL